MHPVPIPQEAGCLVRLMKRGERGPSFSIFLGMPIACVGVKSPDVYAVTLWIDGKVYHNPDLRSDLLGRPYRLEECLIHWREHPHRWAAVTAPKAAS